MDETNCLSDFRTVEKLLFHFSHAVRYNFGVDVAMLMSWTSEFNWYGLMYNRNHKLIVDTTKVWSPFNC